MNTRGTIKIVRLEIDGKTVLENYSETIELGSSSRIALVGCGSQKASTRCAARDMYTSQLFRASRAYAEATCDSWWILSARYGLLNPAAVIYPYDQVLTRRTAEQWGKRIGMALEIAVPFPSLRDVELVVLAGSLYADAIEPVDDREFNWAEPLKGLGIGERLRWLKQNTPTRSP